MSVLNTSGQGRTGLLFAGCLALFFGERMFTASPTVRMGLDAVAALLLLASLGLRLKDVVGGAFPALERRLAALHGLCLLGVTFYVLQVGAVRDALGCAATPGDERDVLGVALAVLWPIVWLAGALPLALLDRAAGPMRRAGAVEIRRIREASRGGLSIALATAMLFVGNFLVTQHDETVDLAYYRTARPGTATVALVKTLESPVRVYLFFPKANDVLEQVQGYFDALAAHTDNLQVEVTDRLLRPGLAKEHQVRQDGTVVLARGAKKERWRIGTKLTSARRDLAKLDGEFNKRLSKVASPERFAYLVTGHGELNNPDRSVDSLAKARDKAVRRVLEWQGYQVKTLGLAEGLGSKVPEDAGLVLVLGPRTPLLAEESLALGAYVRGGGRLLLAIEPMLNVEPVVDAIPGHLLGELGLMYGDGVLTHDRVHLRRRFDASDRQLLPTNSFSSHASVRSLSRDSRHLAVVVDRAGHLERTTGSKGAQGRKIEFTVRTVAGAWADLDGDRQLGAAEKAKTRNISAAVTLPKEEGAAGEGGEAGKALIFADADALSDALMGNKGNVVLLADGLRWLQGEESLSGAIESEEDVAVEHTKEEDALLFHGTVFAMPLFIGGLGWFRLRRRRRQA